MKRFMYRVGMWLLQRSGDAGASEWRDLNAHVEHITRQYYQADRERWCVVEKIHKLRAAISRADSMLSADLPDKAQAQLRVALIETR